MGAILDWYQSINVSVCVRYCCSCCYIRALNYMHVQKHESILNMWGLRNSVVHLARLMANKVSDSIITVYSLVGYVYYLWLAADKVASRTCWLIWSLIWSLQWCTELPSAQCWIRPYQFDNLDYGLFQKMLKLGGRKKEKKKKKKEKTNFEYTHNSTIKHKIKQNKLYRYMIDLLL
jgi:hypothetical protein